MGQTCCNCDSKAANQENLEPGKLGTSQMGVKITTLTPQAKKELLSKAAPHKKEIVKIQSNVRRFIAQKELQKLKQNKQRSARGAKPQVE